MIVYVGKTKLLLCIRIWTITDRHPVDKHRFLYFIYSAFKCLVFSIVYHASELKWKCLYTVRLTNMISRIFLGDIRFRVNTCINKPFYTAPSFTIKYENKKSKPRKGALYLYLWFTIKANRYVLLFSWVMSSYIIHSRIGILFEREKSEELCHYSYGYTPTSQEINIISYGSYFFRDHDRRSFI